MTFLTIWQQDFQKSERLPAEAVQVLIEQGVIRTAFKPNGRGKLKPVLISLDVMSKIRDRSCQMGPRVMEGNAMGRGDCKALVKEWGRNRLRFV